MRFSVISHTCREDSPRLPAPVLQMMVDSMVCQDYKGEFELIIVDLLWERRHEQFAEYLKLVNPKFPVLHIPDKPGPFKERSLLRISSPKNTGLMFARGTHVVFSDDCQVIPENALSLLEEWAQQGLGATFSYERRFRETPDVDYYVTGVDTRIEALETPPGTYRTGPAREVWFIGASVSMIPMRVIEAVNGWDEMFDGSRQLEDSDFLVRIDRTNMIEMAYDSRIRIVEYECGCGGSYGDVVDQRPVKCNAAYGQYVWGLGKKTANDLSGKPLTESILRMQWKDCLRLHEDKVLCVPHLSECYRYDDQSGQETLDAIYRDPRIIFNLSEQRKNVSWDRCFDILGVSVTTGAKND